MSILEMVKEEVLVTTVMVMGLVYIVVIVILLGKGVNGKVVNKVPYIPIILLLIYSGYVKVHDANKELVDRYELKYEETGKYTEEVYGYRIDSEEHVNTKYIKEIRDKNKAGTYSFKWYKLREGQSSKVFKEDYIEYKIYK